MNWEAIGALAELLGAVGVIVTLGFLVYQVKQNTKTTASLIRQNFYDSTQQQILHAVESAEFNQLMNRAWTTQDDLSASEHMQVSRHIQGVLMGYQSAFVQYKSGILPEEDWELVKTYLRSFWLFDGKAKNTAWRQMREGGFFSEDFLAEVESLAEEARSYNEKLSKQDIKF